MPEPNCRNKRKMCTSNMGFSEIKLMFPGLAAIDFTHRDNSLSFICGSEKSVIKQCLLLTVCLYSDVIFHIILFEKSARWLSVKQLLCARLAI